MKYFPNNSIKYDKIASKKGDKMQKVYNIEDDKKITPRVKIFLIVFVILCLTSTVYGIFKSGILNYENGKLSYNEYKIPIYGWAKQIKDLEK